MGETMKNIYEVELIEMVWRERTVEVAATDPAEAVRLAIDNEWGEETVTSEEIERTEANLIRLPVPELDRSLGHWERSTDVWIYYNDVSESEPVVMEDGYESMPGAEMLAIESAMDAEALAKERGIA